MKLFKGFFFALTLAVILSISNSALANDNKNANTEKEKIEFDQYMEEVTEELEVLNRDFTVFDDLTEEDFHRILPQILEIEAQNQHLSKEEVNELVYQFFVKLKEDSSLMIKPFYITIGGANSQETKLCLYNPLDCSKAKSNASTANSKTSEFYTSGFYNGNADAFRHAYWNVLMVGSIGSEMAFRFANAHEYGAENQPTIERDMDLHNNRLGRSSAGYSATQVKNSITRGLGVRIVNNKLVNTNSTGAK